MVAWLKMGKMGSQTPLSSPGMSWVCDFWLIFGHFLRLLGDFGPFLAISDRLGKRFSGLKLIQASEHPASLAWPFTRGCVENSLLAAIGLAKSLAFNEGIFGGLFGILKPLGLHNKCVTG